MRAVILVLMGLWLLAGPAAGQQRTLPAPLVSQPLMDVARDHGLGYVEVLAANPGVDPWVPQPGLSLVLPDTHLLPATEARSGLVVNLGDMRLYDLDRGVSYPIGIGREGWETPLGRTKVVRKREAPTWWPPASIRAEKPELPRSVPPGPDNPLGDHALDLGFQLIRIHGTNRPDGVGRVVSHGCIRLYPEDIAELFAQIRVGTPVTIVKQPAKLGWIDGELYLEVHPSPAQAVDLEYGDPLTADPVPGLFDLVAKAAGADVIRVNWAAVEEAEILRLGLPVQVTDPLR